MIDIEKIVARWVVAGDVTEDDGAHIAVLLKRFNEIMPRDDIEKLVAQYLKSWCALRDDPVLYREQKRRLAQLRRKMETKGRA